MLRFISLAVAFWACSRPTGTRPQTSFGRSLTGAFGTVFWQGVVWGLVILGVDMVAMSVLSGFSFHICTLGFQAIKYGLLWAFVCLLIGLAEEFEYRGYAQFTLTTGMGFWPSALPAPLSHMGSQGALQPAPVRDAPPGSITARSRTVSRERGNNLS